jgi:hypothetical protein
MTDVGPTEFGEILHFTPELREKMEATLQNAFGRELQLDEEQWEELRGVCVRFLQAREYWAGFLSQGQADQVNDAKVIAAKMLATIEKLQTNDLIWVLEDSISGGTSNLKKQLEDLTLLDVKSPKIKVLGKDGKEVPHTLKDRSLLEFQHDFDFWWQKTTGSKPISKDDMKSPYDLFFDHVHSIFPMSIAPGHSHKIIKDRQADLRRPAKQGAKILRHANKMMLKGKKGS